MYSQEQLIASFRYISRRTLDKQNPLLHRRLPREDNFAVTLVHLICHTRSPADRKVHVGAGECLETISCMDHICQMYVWYENKLYMPGCFPQCSNDSVKKSWYEVSTWRIAETHDTGMHSSKNTHIYMNRPKIGATSETRCAFVSCLLPGGGFTDTPLGQRVGVEYNVEHKHC